MKKRLLIALSVITLLVAGFVQFFFAVTATKKQQPVVIHTPTTPAN